MNQLEAFKEIKTFIFDVDGVLTDSSVLVLEDGKLLRKMSIRDGYAIKKAVKKGYKVCVITGGKSEGVKIRLQGLGVTDIYLGASEKEECYEEYINIYGLNPDQIIYMGDDVPDLPVMRRVGLPVCPHNAAPEILSVAKYVSPLKGGEGCARDVIEKVLRLNGHWEEE
ncbi:MAG: HAD-IIIA family hydrolase [Saprospiraceae bacterium]|nr:HAD-IIIA family hydrolase [Saprospiraceae bacterium]